VWGRGEYIGRWVGGVNKVKTLEFEKGGGCKPLPPSYYSGAAPGYIDDITYSQQFIES